MDPRLKQDLIGPGIPNARYSRLVRQEALNRLLAASKTRRELGETKVGVEGVRAEPCRLNKRCDIVDKTDPPDAPPIDIGQAVAVGKVEPKSNIIRLVLAGRNAPRRSSWPEVHDQHTVFAKPEHKIFAMPTGALKTLAFQSAPRCRRGNAIQAGGIGNDNARDRAIDEVVLHHRAKRFDIG